MRELQEEIQTASQLINESLHKPSAFSESTVCGIERKEEQAEVDAVEVRTAAERLTAAAASLQDKLVHDENYGEEVKETGRS